MKNDLLNQPQDLFNNADAASTVLMTTLGDIRQAPESTPYNAATDIHASKSCQELSNKYGIINAVTWGTADAAVQKSWTVRGCTTSPIVAPTNDDSQDDSNTDDTRGKGASNSEDEEVFNSDEETSSDKILGMPKGVAIGVGVAILAIGGFLIYKKVKG